MSDIEKILDRLLLAGIILDGSCLELDLNPSSGVFVWSFFLGEAGSAKSRRSTKTSSGYNLNPKGQPYGAMIALAMTAFVVYVGEPDEVESI